VVNKAYRSKRSSTTSFSCTVQQRRRNSPSLTERKRCVR